MKFSIKDFFSKFRDLEGRRMRIMQIYVLFYFIFFRKSLPLMFYPSYQNGGKILGTEKPPEGRS